MTVIQVALLTAVHAQPACAVTATVPVAAFASTDTDPGVMLNAQGAPDCVIDEQLPADRDRAGPPASCSGWPPPCS